MGTSKEWLTCCCSFNLLLHLCADTLSCWRATVAELDESLAITQLLTALRKVAGFEELANELAQSHGTFDKT